MKFVEAVLMLTGMIIGVGMFAIPFSFVQAGFWLGALELVILASAVTTLHVFYAEIVLKTPEAHRLPGYVRYYLGPRTEKLAKFSTLFGILGALLAYILVGAVFFNGIAQFFWMESSEGVWAFIFTAIGSAVTFFSLRRVAAINGILTAFLVLFILFLILILAPLVQFENIHGFSLSEAFLPYGVLLFALSGGTVIPDVIAVLGRDRQKARRAIWIGSLVPAVLYFLFAFAVVGVSGDAVSEDAMSRLLPFAGGWVTLLGSGIGLLAVFTSYIALSKSFQAMLKLDFKATRTAAWLAAVFLPFLFYFAGFTSFISIIGAVGAIAMGIDAALVIATYIRMHAKGKERDLWRTQFWKVGIIYVVILAGIFYEVYRFLYRG
ncbi:MAG: amino acid permease [Parcubacteria group bacterium Gr01-1014_29]|nr:MAG: amino acid permease [Parcubacteria group bacterium Gr01-1014_29]